jgi:hypothetical protein
MFALHLIAAGKPDAALDSRAIFIDGVTDRRGCGWVCQRRGIGGSRQAPDRAERDVPCSTNGELLTHHNAAEWPEHRSAGAQGHHHRLIRTPRLPTIERVNSCLCCCDFSDCGVVTLKGISPSIFTANVPMVAGHQDRLGRAVGVRKTKPAAPQMAEPRPSGSTVPSEEVRESREEALTRGFQPASGADSGVWACMVCPQTP